MCSAEVFFCHDYGYVASFSDNPRTKPAESCHEERGRTSPDFDLRLHEAPHMGDICGKRGDSRLLIVLGILNFNLLVDFASSKPAAFWRGAMTEAFHY